VSTTAAALIVVGVLAFSLPAAYWQIRRAMGGESTRERLVREVHERARAATAMDPIAIAQADRAGFDRLHAAVRGEQQNGDA
jgi:hypothetical protein